MRWLLVAVMLAGCTASGGVSQFTLSNDDVAPASGEGTVSCGDQATLEVAVGRIDDGSVRLRVLDGGGATAFDETYESGDAGSLDHGLFGAAGTWRVVGSGTFAGRITAQLSC